MAFDSWHEFIWMGGYGWYVWLAYSVTFLAIALLVIHGLLTRKKLRQQAVKMQHQQQRLARRKQLERERSKLTDDTTS